MIAWCFGKQFNQYSTHNVVEIITIHNNKLSLSQCRIVTRVLRSGGVVVYPTDTSYGIGCDATNTAAVKKVFAIKHRPCEKQVSVIVHSTVAAHRYGIFSPCARELARHAWPGALTIIVRRRNGQGTIGLRVANSVIARQLAKGLARPLVSTSANISGHSPCYSWKAFEQQLTHAGSGPYPDLVLTAGTLPRRVPSTVVNATTTPIILLRAGAISTAQLRRLCPLSTDKK